MSSTPSLDQRLGKAIRYFWETRRLQEEKQGSLSGRRDQGARSAVTGGAQLDGVANLIREILIESGVGGDMIHRKKRVALPGFYRPTKDWDLVVVIDDELLAAVELKSHVGPSFGNNYNNRTEEALGSATDLWTAYREGLFKLSSRPWLGYFLLLEAAPRSTSPVKVAEPHFPVFEDFRGASYQRRYELLCEKLVRERLYDAACLILSDRVSGSTGAYAEPSPEIGLQNFIASLTARVVVYLKTQ